MWKVFLILTISFSVTISENTNDNPCDNLPEGHEFVTNPRGCNLYYFCLDGNPYTGSCQPGFHFYESGQSCELPEDVNCTIDDELWNVKCPDQGIAKIPHPYSCSEYTVCLDNNPQDRSCPDGLHFSPYDQECIDPELIHCRIDGNTCKSSVPYVPMYIPSSRDCSTYYVCFNNRLQTFNCGPNQEFDSALRQCVEVSNCDPSGNLSPDLKVPESLTYDCSNEANNSRIPHPESCSFWFWCFNGRSQIFWCGKGALFDIDTRTCTKHDIATCASQLNVIDEVKMTAEMMNERTKSKSFMQTNNELNISDKIVRKSPKIISIL